MKDSQLIERYCRHGDQRAAQELLERYERPLYNYLWQMLRHTQDCEDATQETFRKVLRALPKYREENHFKSWLFRIGHNEALDMIRRRKRTVLDPEPESLSGTSLADSATGGTEALVGKERMEALDEAVSKLPEAEREVIVLRLQTDLPFREIADVTGAPLGTVLARMHSAKKRLKALLKPALS